MEITREYNILHDNFKEYFLDTKIIPYFEDVISYILNDGYMGICTDMDNSEILEMIALQSEDYFSETDMNVSRDFIYSFFYIHSSDILSLLDIIRNEHKRLQTSYNIKTEYNENLTIKCVFKETDIYLTFDNNTIIKYTTLHDITCFNNKKTFKLINLNDTYILFKNLMKVSNDIFLKDFFVITEIFLCYEDKPKINYDIYKSEVDKNLILSMDEFIGFNKILKSTLKEKVNFFGWVKDSFMLKVNNV